MRLISLWWSVVLEAFPAVYRSAFGWLKWYFSFLFAVCANSLMHLSWTVGPEVSSTASTSESALVPVVSAFESTTSIVSHLFDFLCCLFDLLFCLIHAKSIFCSRNNLTNHRIQVIYYFSCYGFNCDNVAVSIEKGTFSRIYTTHSLF